MNLYDITSELLYLQEQEEETLDTERLNSVQLSFDKKMGNCGAVIKNFNGEIDAIDNEVSRLRSRKLILSNKAKSLKNYMQEAMERSGVKKSGTAIHKVSLCSSPLSVDIIDEDHIDNKYIEEVVQRKVKKRLIINHVKATGEIPAGVDVEQRYHVRIK